MPARTTLAALILAFASCRSADVAEYSLATPEQALRSFQRANVADNYEFEFRSLASRLKTEMDLSYNTYTLGRDSFMRQHRRELALFLESDIARVEYSPDGTTARVELAAEGQVGEIVLVNEPFCEWVADDGAGRAITRKVGLDRDVPAYVSVSDGRTVVDVPLGGGDEPPPGRIAEFRVARAWKFLELLGIREFRFDEAAAEGERRKGAGGKAEP